MRFTEKESMVATELESMSSWGRAAVAAAFAASCLMLLVLLAPAAQAASPGWKLLGVTGPTNVPPYSSDRQSIVVSATSGTFRVTFDGSTTTDIPSSATPAQVESALNALPSISAGGGSVSVSGGPGNSIGREPYVVSFDGGPLAGTSVPQMTVASGTPPLAGTVTMRRSPSSTIRVVATNVGGAPTTGSYTVDLTLPPGLTTSETPYGADRGNDWTCTPTGAGQSQVSCSQATSVPAGFPAPALNVPVTAETTAEGVVHAQLSVSGGGAASGDDYEEPITISSTPAQPGVQAMWTGAFDADGIPYTQAGGHPFTATAAFVLNSVLTSRNRVIPAGSAKDINVALPAGFVANPLVARRCPRDDKFCSSDAIVGNVGAAANDYDRGFGARGPLHNVLPPPRRPAELSFIYSLARIVTTAKLRPDDYGVTSLAPNLPAEYFTYGSVVTLWGQPGSSVWDSQRCRTVVCPSPNPATLMDAFVTNPTECTGAELVTGLETDTWQNAGVFATASSSSPAITGCSLVPFEPSTTVVPTSEAPDSASGLKFDLALPQEGLIDPEAIATSHLKDVVVDMPEGMSVNPSGATGLQGCSDAQVGVGDNEPPACPDGSKIGAVRITSPLVDRPIGGTLYLGEPRSTDPASGEMLRLFVVAREDDLGIMVKLPGSATADPSTGKLRATFRNNPRLPFDTLQVEVKGGAHGVLATPQACGGKSIAATLSPWSGTADVSQQTQFDVAGDCSFGFAPSLEAGMDSRAARGSGAFSFRFSRRDGEQMLSGLTARLPKGLLASVKDVPLCQDAQAVSGTCPAASRIGVVDAAAGAGDPFVLEQKGEVFLTEGYKGGAYGLAVKIRPVAGPFRGQWELSPIIVRQAIHVDRKTAQVTAVSDPLPQIHHGVPLRVREVTVRIDRGGFMLNPSDCSAKQVGATLSSVQRAVGDLSQPFQASGCAALSFEPKLTMRLIGRKQVTTGKHPGVKAVVTQAGASEAGIEQAVVRLPKSLALDPNNAQALCEFADGTKPDLENHCPKGSIVGRARAVTPLLDKPLAGNVYFVKNIRIDSKTGNEIRTLPMIVVALRGEIAVNLTGESSTTRGGKLVNTFADVPDAPISRFNLNITGGRNGILAVTRTRRATINLCAGRHIAEVDNDGQNGRRHDFDVRMKTPCSKRQVKRAKRSAKRAAKQAARRG